MDADAVDGDNDDADDDDDAEAIADTNCADASTNALVFGTFNVHGISVTDTMINNW